MSSSSSSGNSDSGRHAVPRGSRDDGGRASSSRREDSHDGDGGRYAVDRSGGASDERGARARQSHRGSSRHHGGGVFYGGWWDPWYYNHGPWWGWSWGWGWSGWGPWSWGPAGVYYDRPYRSGRGSGYGALDTDVWPGDAEIYVDGERVGTADDFDGFPTYLWLPRGTYDVVIYLQGFQTIARQYTIYDGLVIDVDDRMQRGEARRPEELPATTHERRDERLRNDAELQERARRREEWRQRQDGRDDSMPSGPGAAPAPSGGTGDGAHVHLTVSPGDASVYLDGNFLGTGSELAQLSAGVLVPPGSHRLEVVRPGYEAEALDFQGNPGEDLQLNVELDED